MLIWDFKEQVGTLTINQKRGGEDHWFTLYLYKGNALMIILSEWDESPSKHMYNLFAFIADRDHLKNLSKDADFFREWRSITINRKYYKKAELNALINTIGDCNPECTIILK